MLHKAIPLGGVICFNITSSRKIEFCFSVSYNICFEVLLKVPEELLTTLFINTRILKFKRQLTFAFFAAVNHLSGALRKQRLNSTSSKGHGLWFVIGGFRSVFIVSVFQGSLLVMYLWLTAAKNVIVNRFRVRVFLKSAVKIQKGS